MKIWQIIFLVGALILAAMSGWNVFFSRRPEFQNIIYFPAALIMLYSAFSNFLFVGDRTKIQRRRELENKRRDHSDDQ